MKKKIKILTALALIGAIIGFTSPAAFAAKSGNEEITDDYQKFTIGGGNGIDYGESDGDPSCRGFLGMTSWDCGLNDASWDEKNIKNTIIKIIFNISSDLTILAAYLVLGFVIYGGYRYLLSGGDASHVAAGKRILMHAFIGLAIVMLSNVIFNALRFGMLSGSESVQKTVGGVTINVGTGSAGTLFASSIAWIIGMAGVAALVFVVYGAILYITANGNAATLQRAKDTIMYAAIGLLVVGLAEAITAFVSSKISESKKYGEEQTSLDSSIVRVISLEELNHEETI